MWWTYVISIILMCVLWYVLKHAYYKTYIGLCKYEWRPIEIRRWYIMLAVVLFFIAVVNVLVVFFALLYITVDPCIKIEVDNRITRSWDKVIRWMNKKIRMQ